MITVPFYFFRLSVKRARRLVEEVGKAATRLESSFESRRATIRNLAVLRSIEDQAHEVSLAQINMSTRKSSSLANWLIRTETPTYLNNISLDVAIVMEVRKDYVDRQFRISHAITTYLDKQI